MGKITSKKLTITHKNIRLEAILQKTLELCDLISEEQAKVQVCLIMV